MASLGVARLPHAFVSGVNRTQQHPPEAGKDLAAWSHRPQRWLQVLQKHLWQPSVCLRNSLTQALSLVFDQGVKDTWGGSSLTLAAFFSKVTDVLLRGAGSTGRVRKAWVPRERRFEVAAWVTAVLLSFVLGTSWVLNFSWAFCNKYFHEAILELWSLSEAAVNQLHEVSHFASLTWEHLLSSS